MQTLGRIFRPMVLCYHQISEERLRSHVRFLKRFFEVVPLNVLLKTVFEEGKTGNGLVALTMDDCYETDFANAAAVCQSEKVHCTFFLPVNYSLGNKGFWPQRLKNLFDQLGQSYINEGGTSIRFSQAADKAVLIKDYFFNYNQNDLQTTDIEAMVDRLYAINSVAEAKSNPVISMEKALGSQGLYISFESHSLTHPKLFLCKDQETDHELAASKAAFKTYLNHESNSFCYPYGSMKHIGNSWKMVGKHYKYGFTLERGTVQKSTNPLLIPRVDFYEHDNLLKMAAKLVQAKFKGN